MKKTVAVLLLITILTLCFSVFAETASGDSKDVRWTLDENGVLRISGEGETASFMLRETWSAWKPYNEQITKIIIENGVTKIGWHAFAGCTNLTEVVIPDSVETIELKAFMDCPNLLSVTIPAGVKKIGDDAFLGCGGPEEDMVRYNFFQSRTECEKYFSSRGVVLNVTPGSYAEQYAIEHSLSYNNGSVTVSGERVRLMDKADAVIASCIREGMTEEQKAKALHDWIVRNASYGGYADLREPAANILLNGKGFCGDFAAAYELLLSRANIANCVLWGSINGESHLWNMVRIDGQWYHVDTTASTTSGGTQYFMMNDTQIRQDHSWEDETSADRGIIPFGIFFDPDK